MPTNIHLYYLLNASETILYVLHQSFFNVFGIKILGVMSQLCYDISFGINDVHIMDVAQTCVSYSCLNEIN